MMKTLGVSGGCSADVSTTDIVLSIATMMWQGTAFFAVTNSSMTSMPASFGFLDPSPKLTRRWMLTSWKRKSVDVMEV